MPQSQNGGSVPTLSRLVQITSSPILPQLTPPRSEIQETPLRTQTPPALPDLNSRGDDSLSACGDIGHSEMSFMIEYSGRRLKAVAMRALLSPGSDCKDPLNTACKGITLEINGIKKSRYGVGTNSRAFSGSKAEIAAVSKEKCHKGRRFSCYNNICSF